MNIFQNIEEIRKDQDSILNLLKSNSATLTGIGESLANIDSNIAIMTKAIIQFLNSLETGKAVDLDIVVGSAPPTMKGSASMANKKGTGPGIKCPALKKSSGGMKAVMTPVTLTAVPASITLQPVDGATPPNPVPIAATDSVQGTLVSDSNEFVVAAGTDTLHYVATIPANVPQGTVVNLSATLNGTIQGAAANFTASVQITLNIPPSPVAVDLDIIIA
jgi:hypothetical protein